MPKPRTQVGTYAKWNEKRLCHTDDQGRTKLFPRRRYSKWEVRLQNDGRIWEKNEKYRKTEKKSACV